MKKKTLPDGEKLFPSSASDLLLIQDHAAAERLWPHSISASMGEDDDCESEDWRYERIGNAAVVTIDGPLTQRGGWWWDGYESILERCAAALKNSSVSTLVLRISSPGGVVAGCFDSVRMLREMIVASGKRCVAYGDGCACSAAYAICCAADEIVVSESTSIGSVGVIATAYSIAKANEKMGIDARVMTSGDQKADLHPLAPLTEEAVKRQEARINALGMQFASLVAERRKMSTDAVLGLQAAVMLGRDAVAAGLADRIGTLASVISSAPAVAPGSVSGIATSRQEQRMESVLKLLGCASGATEAEVSAVIERMKAEQMAVQSKLEAAQSHQQQLLAITGKSNPSEAIGTALAWKMSAEKASAEADALRSEVEGMKQVAMKSAREEKLSSLVASGRLAPAQVESARALSPEAFNAFVSVLEANAPLVAMTPSATRPQSGSAPTQEALAVIKQLGISEAEFTKVKVNQ